jgi:hypothetical protein
MRGDLDDALARLRRWDEVRQRLAGGSTAEQSDAPPEPPPPPTPGPAVAEAIDALGDIVRRHPGVVVTVTVREVDLAWTTEVAWGIDGRPAVTPPELSVTPPELRVMPPEPSEASPAWGSGTGAPPNLWPDTEDTDRSDRTAARLADLIRHDPSLLDPPGEPLR